MADKQNNDSMVNAQDNDEWVQTETPVQAPVTPVLPPVTPVIVKQEALPYGSVTPIFVATPDDLLAQHRRNARTEVNILLFVSTICAYLAFFNFIDLFYMDFKKAASETVAFTVLKMTVGLLGAILLSTEKFTAIKAYAVAFMLVYGCYVGFFMYNAFMHRDEITQKSCSAWMFHVDRSEHLECLARVWNALMLKGVFVSIFAFFGFAITFDYASKAMKFMKAEEKREEEKETDIV
eukprot:GEMP01078826.1.p1 GENE.GEMP01078826.1~~GEMP01078826.1.p1  ORF type:complete len:236 (+),score=52.22 GEMP01078826.1:63-770(+)